MLNDGEAPLDDSQSAWECPAEAQRSWAEELYVLAEPDECSRSGRPVEQPFPRMARYLPFVFLLVVVARRYGKQVVVATGIGIALFGLSSVLAVPVVGAGVAMESFVGIGLVMWTVGGRGLSWLGSHLWVVWAVMVAAYAGHVVSRERYLRKLRRDEDAIVEYICEHVPLDQHGVAGREWLLPKSLSLRMRDREGVAFWVELAVWSSVGAGLLGVLFAEKSGIVDFGVASIPVVDGGVLVGVYVGVALLVSRTLHVALIEDAVGGLSPPGGAALWRLGARVPLLFFAGVVLIGGGAQVGSPWMLAVLGCTAGVGVAYVAVRVYRTRVRGLEWECNRVQW